MSDFNSCLLQNFGVLAGPPSRVKAVDVSTTYAIISWQPPKILPDTVTEYHVYLRKLGSGADYNVVEKDHQPIIVEDLEPGTRYEIFVVSMNAHGKGGPSPRLVLQTKHEVKQNKKIYPELLCNLSFAAFQRESLFYKTAGRLFFYDPTQSVELSSKSTGI